MPSGTPASLTTIHQDEVLTGEAVALDVQPLGYFLRAVGGLIDLIVAIVLLLALALSLSALVANGVVPVAASQAAFIVVFAVVAVVVPTTVETLTRGRSVGKLAVGGRIVRNDGGATGFRHAAIRALVGVLEIYLTFGSVALLVGAFTPRAQRLGDLLAGTYSERTRTPPLPAPAPGLPPGMEVWASIADVARLPDRLARRIAGFARDAERMDAGARDRIARELAAEASDFVRPIPPVSPEVMLRSVAAVRRDREYRAIELENQRVAALTAGLDTRRSA